MAIYTKGVSDAPLIPVAEALEMADDDYVEGAMEPVPSALFDELAPDLEPYRRLNERFGL